MDFRRYQAEALLTDRMPIASEGDEVQTSTIIPLLGLAGEAGQLLSEYKKYLRDRDAHLQFKERVAEELGDLLWYTSNVASKFDLDLNDIAEANLAKVRDRWDILPRADCSFDDLFPPSERMPRRFDVELRQVEGHNGAMVRTLVDGQQVGDVLTDNAFDPDGYRFHDVFHLSYAAILGWSPITRKILKRKRKSDPRMDHVEDGGRAAAIEEGISALVFSYAREHGFLAGVKYIDYKLLRDISSMTSHLEVKRCGAGDWQRAILDGYSVWRDVVAHSGGRLRLDLDHRSIEFIGVG